MATYYIDKIGAQIKYRVGDWPDASNGTAPSPNTLRQISLTLTGVGDIFVLAPRVWTAPELNSSAASFTVGIASQVWRKPSALDPGGKVGDVIFDGAGLGANVVNLNAAATLSGIEVRNADTNFSDVHCGAAGSTLQDVVLNGGWRGFNVGAASIKFSRVVVKNTAVFAGDINSAGASLTWDTGRLENNTGSIRLLNGTFKYSNVLGIGQKGETVVVSGNNAQVLEGRNNILHGPTNNAGKHTLLNSSSNATCSESNSLIGYNPFGPTYLSSGVTLTNCITDKSARFRSRRRRGIISIVIDDAESAATYEGLAPLLEARGYRGTWAINTTYATTHDLWGAARAYAAAGHEIASHSRSHVQVDATSAINLQYTGLGTACALTIDNAAKTLTTAVAGAADNLSINLASYTFIGLVNYLNATGKYSASVVVASNNEARAEHMASVAGQDIKTASYATTINTAQYMAYEITGSKSDIESNVPGYTCKAFVNPYFNTSAAVKDVIASSGYLGARIDSAGTRSFADIEAFAVYGSHVGVLFGTTASNPTPEQIKGRVAALVDYLDYTGGIVVILAHLLTGANDYSLANWGHVLDGIQQAGANVLTFGQAMESIIANAETVASGGGAIRYQRSEAHLGDASDYRLRPDSPCINAGTVVAGIHDQPDYKDMAGRTLRGIPDIGPYEYWPTVKRKRLGLRLGL